MKWLWEVIRRFGLQCRHPQYADHMHLNPKLWSDPKGAVEPLNGLLEAVLRSLDEEG